MTLANLLETGLAKRPRDLALSDGRTRLSFEGLDERAQRVARGLREAGILPGDTVVVAAEKCCEIVAAAIGIWKAGAIYVPVDPDSPPARLAFILDGVGPKAFIGPRKWLDSHASRPEGSARIAFESLRDPAAALERFQWKEVEASPADTAYILHTSGSTGRPKGVEMSHEAVLAYFDGHNDILGFDTTSSCQNNAPFYFDVSIQDTFLPLSFGATVFLTRGLPVGSLLLRQLEAERITHLIAVSTILTLIVGKGDGILKSDLSALKVVMTGAEVCRVDVINAWFGANRDIRVVNGYGPTEANSISVVNVLASPEPGRQHYYPIGKPLRTVETVLVSEEGKPITRPDEIGELLIGGPQLMKGYWRNEVETRKAFHWMEGRKYYRTGDLCHYDGEGKLVFAGRNDSEVKIAGRRINLAEVQAALLRRGSIRNSCVGLIEHSGQKHISAILHNNPEDPVECGFRELEALRCQLKEDLPDYMVPRFIGISDIWMVLGTGKTDTRQLLSLLEQAVDREHSPYYQLAGARGFVALGKG